MAEAYIVEAVRTAGGRRNGRLKDWHPADMAGEVLDALVVSKAALKTHGLTPIPRIVNMTVTAADPVIMLEEPMPATKKALQRAGLTIGDIGLYEVNEAFALVPLAWLKELGADPARMNVNGGAIALGHPLGATGTKLMATLIHARGERNGLQTMCEGGGIANVAILKAP